MLLWFPLQKSCPQTAFDKTLDKVSVLSHISCPAGGKKKKKSPNPVKQNPQTHRKERKEAAGHLVPNSLSWAGFEVIDYNRLLITCNKFPFFETVSGEAWSRTYLSFCLRFEFVLYTFSRCLPYIYPKLSSNLISGTECFWINTRIEKEEVTLNICAQKYPFTKQEFFMLESAFRGVSEQIWLDGIETKTLD